MATVVFLPLAPGHGTVLVSRAGLFLPRTTAASAEPWAHFVLPGAAAPRYPTETAPPWTCQTRTSLLLVVVD